MSINKLIRETQPTTISQNNTWHSEKALKKAVLNIGAGPKCLKGKTWHWQLEDKAILLPPMLTGPCRTGQNADALQSCLINIINHYKNNHTNCHPSSQCKRDPKYEPSCSVTTDPVMEKLLYTAITKSVLHTRAQDYILRKRYFSGKEFQQHCEPITWQKDSA